jgi:hypothetical protein
MIRMLVRDENTVYVAQVQIQLFQGFHGPLSADARIHQDMGRI